MSNNKVKVNMNATCEPNYLCESKIFTIDDIMSQDDCTNLIMAVTTAGFNKSSQSGGGHGRTGREDARTSEFHVMIDNVLSSKIWNSIKKFAPPDVTHLSASGYVSNANVAKEWKPVMVNDRIRIYKYEVGEVFPEHIDYKMCRKVYRDGKQYQQMTFMTLLIYLNDNFEGGQTGFWTQHDEIGKKEHCRFLRGSENKPHQVVVTPVTGMVLINDQNLLHEGMAPTKGTKYVLRTDIVYERELPMHAKILKTLPSDYFKEREEEWEKLFETSCKNYAD
jgi:hypothetical protein